MWGCLSAFPFRRTEDLLPQPLGEQAVDSYQLSFSPGACTGLGKASLSKGSSHLMAGLPGWYRDIKAWPPSPNWDNPEGPVDQLKPMLSLHVVQFFPLPVVLPSLWILILRALSNKYPEGKLCFRVCFSGSWTVRLSKPFGDIWDQQVFQKMCSMKFKLMPYFLYTVCKFSQRVNRDSSVKLEYMYTRILY